MGELSNYDKMLSGEPFFSPDWDLIGMQTAARVKLDVFNVTPMSQMEQRFALLRDMLGSIVDDCVVLSPLHFEYGKHIHLGDCFINFDCVFLDGAEIRIGDGTLVAPRVQFLTANHPVRADERLSRDPETGKFNGGWSTNRPITVGDGCWIGAGAIILAGVTIGDRTTVGAGSVVTKSLPPDVLAVGNPARVVRSLL